jgi:glycerol-3-phosphate dehydrogenase
MVPGTDDGRVLFAIPWHNRVLVGTTDTPAQNASLEPRPLTTEVKYLLDHAARYLTRDPLPRDILSTAAGLRPLLNHGNGRRTSKLSRDFALIISPSGLVTITGGKWTTYRKMGEDTVEQAALVAGLEERESRSRNLRVHGWLKNVDRADPLHGYGSDARSIREIVRARPELGEPLHGRLPYVKAEVLWAARHEMARTVEDVLARRTRALLLDARASIEAAPPAAELLAAELGRDAAWQQEQVREYSALAKGYLLT